MNFADCLRRAGESLAPEDVEALRAAIKEHLASGKNAKDAAVAAVTKHLEEAQGELKEVVDAIGKAQAPAQAQTPVQAELPMEKPVESVEKPVEAPVEKKPEVPTSMAIKQTEDGQFEVTVKAGPHEGVSAVGDTEAQARRLVAAQIRERNAAKTPEPEAEKPPEVPKASKEEQAAHQKRLKQDARTASADSFRDLTNAPDLHALADKPYEEFKAAAEKANSDWIAKQQGTERAEAAVYSAAHADDKYFQSLHKSVQKAAKQAALDAARDPAVHDAALGEAMASAKIADDPDANAAFLDGWQHALTGKTASTLVGGADTQAGYKAAKDWIQTPDGEAWYTGKRVNKLENTGVDLRRHWEQLRDQIKAKNDAEGVTAVNQIYAATTRADFFRDLPAPDATPGTSAYVDLVRSKVRTFQDWMDETGGLTGGWNYEGRRSRRTTPQEKITGFVTGTTAQGSRLKEMMRGIIPDETLDALGWNSNHDATTVDDRVQWLKRKASEYVEGVSEISKTLQGSKTIDEAATRFTNLLWSKMPTSHWDSLGKESGTPWAQKNSGLFNERMRDMYWTPDKKWGETAALVKKENDTNQQLRAQPLVPPRLDSVTRTDLPPLRKGKDVTPEQFKNDLGFSSVGFGKWVKGKEDQDHLNYAYDALNDLANHIGIDPKLMGFGGWMHFTIGALGHGKYAAHFARGQPHPEGGTVNVINVTKTKGDGTVAHEWLHALDYYLRETPDGVKAMGQLVQSLKYRNDMNKIRGHVIDNIKRGGTGWSRGGRKMNLTAVEAAELAIDHYTTRGASSTAYYIEAQKLGKDYWANDRELPARAWEAFVGDTMAGKNTYLVNPGFSGEGMAKPPAYRGTPYPTGEERKAFNGVFKALTAALTVKDGKLTIDANRFEENNPESRQKFLEAAQALKAEIPMLALQIEKEAEWAKGAAKREVDAANEAAAAVEAAAEREKLAETPPNETPPLGDTPMGEEDLSALFDQAANELREQNANHIDAQDVGERALNNETPDKEQIAQALSSTPEQTGPRTSDDWDKMGYGDRQTIAEASDLGGMRRVVHRISGSKWAELSSGERASMQQAIKKTRGESHTASTLIAEAAKNGVTGVDEALKGLTKLFGGGKIQSFPGGLDEATYREAKPHFQAALKAFQEAGKNLSDLFKLLIQQFGEGVKPYAIRFAQEEKLGGTLAQNESASNRVSNWIRKSLRNGAKTDWKELFRLADEEFGGTQAEGKYTPKDAYDAAEMGMNKYILEHPELMTINKPESVIAELKRLTDLLPTQTKRTPEMDEYQQFSTVPALAFVANWVAGIKPGEQMLEPSAGVGGLAAFAKAAGAHVTLNELSSRRAALLRELFPDSKVFSENAELLNAILPQDVRPTVIVMNPPFSATAGRVQGQRKSENGADHIEQALQRLAPGGRLVAIVGEGMGADKPAFRQWWNKIKDEYNVKANIPVDGTEYAKYGTTFDNQLLVIDKNGPTKEEIVTTPAKAYAELPAILKGIRDDRPALDKLETVATEPSGGELASRGLEGEPGPADSTGRLGSGEPAGPASGDRGPGGRTEPNATGQGGGVGGGRRLPGGSSVVSGRPEAGGKPTAGSEVGAGNDRGPSTGEKSGVELDTVGLAARNAALTDSTFEPYVPQKVRIKGAQPHPGALVESAAMAAVDSLDPKYTPNLPEATIKQGKVSDAQLEAVTYAGQAHQEFLPTGERRGYFIGDGTGVGKGREISGIILDNLRQGRKTAVWMSANHDLMTDAKRDYGGVGGDANAIFSHAKFSAKEEIPREKAGILFSTYSTLRGGEKKTGSDTEKAGKTRLQQIIDWLGPDFDGVVAFDEAHALNNLGGGESARGTKSASQQALAGADMQRQLPKARFVYVSATGATEVNNLMFASRLGLWGENTAFAGPKEFAAGIGAKGLAAMELVARDMKAQGSYIARSLSYDGVTQEKMAVPLTSLQRDIYDELAKAWQVVLKNVHAALDHSKQGKNPQAKSNALSAFWSSHQRFFNQIITSMMTPAVLDHAKTQLAEGKSVVFQLVNTNEAIQKRALAEAKAEGTELEELDFTPRKSLIGYVEKSFPVARFVAVSDPRNPDKVIYVPAKDSEGNPVIDPVLVAKRDALIKTLETIRVPDNPLDLILRTLGHEKVAEITGRTSRVIQKKESDGEIRLVEEKRGSKSNEAEALQFQAGKRRALVFSDAGGTGFSFHSDLGAKNQQQRVHYGLQPGWQANKFVQGLGRTHRSNEANQPHVVLPTTDLHAQKRFISSIARRLDQLGALTKGQRDTAGQGLLSNRDNLESEYAKAAARQLFNDMAPGKDTIPRAAELLDQMGLSDIYDENGVLVEAKAPTIQRFLNRLLSLTVDAQNEMFGHFEQRMNAAVEAAVQSGKYDDGMQTVRALKIDKVREDPIYTDERTGAQTKYIELNLTKPLKTTSFDSLLTDLPQQWPGKDIAYFQHNRDGSVFAVVDLGERTDASGRSERWGYRVEPRGRGDKPGRYITNYGSILNAIERKITFERKEDIQAAKDERLKTGTFVRPKLTQEYERLSPDQLAPFWKEQFDKAPRTIVEPMHLLTGTLLPVWDRIQTNGTSSVIRTQTDAGERMIGLQIPKAELKEVLTRFGLGAVKKDAPVKELIARIMAGETAEMANGWDIKKSFVSGENRLELVTPYLGRAEEETLAKKGVITERIQWADRRFIPTGDNMESVFEAVTRGANRPIVEFRGGKQEAEGGGIDLNALQKTKAPEKGPSVMEDRAPAEEILIPPYLEKDDPRRINMVARLNRIAKLIENDNSPAAWQEVRGLLAAKKEASEQRAMNAAVDRVRGNDWVRERLLRAKRREEIDPGQADLGLWLLDQNPNLARDLALTVKGVGSEGQAANYNPAERLVSLIAGKGDTTTVAHEILHHSERMLPPEVQQGIRNAWAKDLTDFQAWGQKVDSGIARRAVADVLRMNAGDREAQKRVNDMIRNGELPGDFYALTNPSEYWAENGSRILNDRAMAGQAWVARARQWLKEFIEKVKHAFGLQSDAAVLRGLQEVLDGTGQRKSRTMIFEDQHGTGMEKSRQDVYPALDKPGTIPGLGVRREDLTHSVSDLFKKTSDFNWINTRFNTMYHLAEKSPGFKKVFDKGQAFLNDTARFATEASDQAPDWLMRLTHLSDILKAGPAKDDRTAATKALYDGTLAGENAFDGHVFTQPEFEEKYGKSPEAWKLYTEGRNAVDRSLQDTATALAARHARRIPGFDDSIAEQAKYKPEQARELYDAEIQRLLTSTLGAQDELSNPAREQHIKKVGNSIDQAFQTAQDLADAGYFPLKRWGKYTTYVHGPDENGEDVTHHFSMSDSKLENERVARAMQEAFPEATVETGTHGTEAYKMMEGISPDTLAVFAKSLDAEDDAVFQKYLKLAIADHSALKQMIHRKGTPGFEADVSRTLAAFITSNARFSARAYHAEDMMNAANAISKGEGHVADQAYKLVDYLQHPESENAGVRSLLFMNFLGGSVASALTNMTQPILQTLPHLARFEPVAQATSRLLRAAKVATLDASEIKDPGLRAAMHEADERGITSPHELYQLYAETIQGLGNNLAWRKFQRAWGGFFALSETFNRKITFAAAWELAKSMTPEQLHAAKAKDAFEFAARAVAETQSIYNRGNRPTWARGPVGATIFTFKQFSIQYLEFLARMARDPKHRPAAALAVSLLVAASGVQGLPFAQNIEDIIDTIGQSLGWNTNSKAWLRRKAVQTLGQGAGEFVTRGVTGIPGMPFDMSGRLGMGNLLPATDIFKPSNKDRMRSLAQVAGPTGTLATNALTAYDAAQAGNPLAAATAMMPSAVSNAVKGAKMFTSGHAVNSVGAKTVDVTQVDAMFKALGLNPYVVAKDSVDRGEFYQYKDMMQKAHSGILDQIVRAKMDHDAEAEKVAWGKLKAWNENNPDTKINLTQSSVQAQIRQRNLDAKQRLVRGYPKQDRAALRESLAHD